MLTKKELCKDLILKNNIFICPLCKEKLYLKNDTLLCKNNHSFDISKKGNLFLIKTNNYKASLIYNVNLFKNRRNFINHNFYNEIYEVIANFINSLNFDKLNILDLGCGEGVHSKLMQEKIKINNNLIGIDYSKDAINMATDYLQYGNIYCVGDINNLPIQDKTINLIINFLSPYNTLEINRILKNDGYFIKVVPGDNYLKELREAFHMEDYEKKDEVKNNILKNFDIIQEYNVNNVKKINLDELDNLINMTPMLNKTISKNISEITINMIIYIMKKR